MIEAGEYVRTDDGRIIKIDGSWKYSTNNKGTILFINITKIPVNYYTKKIIKHSKNIIDLIEVGDIVEVSDVLHNDIVYIWNEKMLKALKEDIEIGMGIKSIVRINNLIL